MTCREKLRLAPMALLSGVLSFLLFSEHTLGNSYPERIFVSGSPEYQIHTQYLYSTFSRHNLAVLEKLMSECQHVFNTAYDIPVTNYELYSFLIMKALGELPDVNIWLDEYFNSQASADDAALQLSQKILNMLDNYYIPASMTQLIHDAINNSGILEQPCNNMFTSDIAHHLAVVIMELHELATQRKTMEFLLRQAGENMAPDQLLRTANLYKSNFLKPSNNRQSFPTFWHENPITRNIAENLSSMFIKREEKYPGRVCHESKKPMLITVAAPFAFWGGFSLLPWFYRGTAIVNNNRMAYQEWRPIYYSIINPVFALITLAIFTTSYVLPRHLGLTYYINGQPYGYRKGIWGYLNCQPAIYHNPGYSRQQPENHLRR